MAQTHSSRKKPVVYHIMLAGRWQVAVASRLVREGPRVAVQLDPDIVGREGVFVEIDAAKLRPLDEEGLVYGYPELADRRAVDPRRQRTQKEPLRTPGRRASDRSYRRA